ncbi:hypothetical protein HAX54_021802, partial [Datura stramonium]|nr:hypothetical protein [Datura stramonium]
LYIQSTYFVFCGGTLRFSGHWILTNVFVTQADILGRKMHGSTPSSPPNRNYEITPRMPSASRVHRPTI